MVPFAGLPGADCSVKRCEFEDMRLADDRERAMEHRFYQTDRAASRRGMSLSGVEIKMTFCRLALNYVANVGMIMFLICSFVLTAWASPEVADRQAVDFTLLLTAVAFKLVVVSLLPPVAYFTYIDYYVMACMLFLAMVTTLHGLLPYAVSHLGEEEAEAFDNACFTAACVFWGTFNAACRPSPPTDCQ